MFLYNTFSKQKEEFKPFKDNVVKMYTCGPTVYDYAHIGNFRSYLATDFLRRALEFLDYKVIQVKNITDVGHLTQDDIDTGQDKIELKARKEKISPQEVARFYENSFREDEAALNIKPAEFYPRATENVPEMIEAIKNLIKKGFAYQKEGAVFFDIKKFNRYGKLSGNTLEKLQAGKRILPDSRKKNPFDFYLWRPAEKNHLMRWSSPWGDGYPGWHIECSVMSQSYLKSKTLDIHTGGKDNIFPHHENEIAQSEALSGEKFVNYWFHAGYLLVDGEKMAKSKGNFYTLKDIIAKGYTPIMFRLLVFGAHYQSTLDFSWAAMNQARANLSSIEEFLRRLENTPSSESSISDEFLNQARQDFIGALEDDLDTPRALASVFRLIKNINSKLDNHSLNQESAQKIKALFLEFNQIMGLNLGQEEIPQQVIDLAEQRQALRKEGKFQEADKARKKITSLGYEISDTNRTYLIRKK